MSDLWSILDKCTLLGLVVLVIINVISIHFLGRE